MRAPTVLALVVTVLLAGCSSSGGSAGSTPTSSAPPRDLPPLSVLVAGDSLADGYFASDRAHAFTALLYDDLASDHELTEDTVAVSGARALGVAIELEKDPEPAPVDVVVLEVGGNDVGESTMKQWTRTYERLLAAVEATAPAAEVLCLGPWNSPAASRPYEEVVQDLCADHVYVPLSDLYAASANRGPAGSETQLGARDEFHPNDQGHAAIAERVRAAI